MALSRRSLTLEVKTPVVVVLGAVGTLCALHPLSAWALSGPHITHPPWHSAVDVTHTRQTAQGVALLQGVVTMTTSVTEMAFYMVLKEGKKKDG